MAKCIRCKQDKPFTVLSKSYPICPECQAELDQMNAQFKKDVKEMKQQLGIK